MNIDYTEWHKLDKDRWLAENVMGWKVAKDWSERMEKGGIIYRESEDVSWSYMLLHFSGPRVWSPTVFIDQCINELEHYIQTLKKAQEYAINLAATLGYPKKINDGDMIFEFAHADCKHRCAAAWLTFRK